MKAMVINGFGKEVKLQSAKVPAPEMLNNDVLIEVFAASINPLDLKIKNGLKGDFKLPLVMGNDFAGIVIKTSKAESRFRAGDKVYGRPSQQRSGTFAEYIAVNEAEVAFMPINLDFDGAASIPLVGLTSYQALCDVLKLKAGQKLLIHAGSGGVGTFAIQLAKALGCYVATTTSTANADWLKALGADEAIDYKQQKFNDVLHDYDAVFDTLGGQSLIDSFGILKNGGKIVSLIGLAGDDAEQRIGALQSQYGVEYHYHHMQASGKQLADITNYIEHGKIKPVIDRIFPIKKAQAAMEYLQGGHAKGKIVLKIK